MIQKSRFRSMALCCTILYWAVHASLRRNGLQCTALHYTALNYSALNYCNALHFTALHCTVYVLRYFTYVRSQRTTRCPHIMPCHQFLFRCAGPHFSAFLQYLRTLLAVRRSLPREGAVHYSRSEGRSSGREAGEASSEPARRWSASWFCWFVSASSDCPCFRGLLLSAGRWSPRTTVSLSFEWRCCRTEMIYIFANGRNSVTSTCYNDV